MSCVPVPWVLSTSLMSHAVGYYKSPLCSSECCLSSLKVSNCYFDNWLDDVGWYILHHFTMELACDGRLEVPYLQVDSESNSWPKPRVELQLWAWQRGQCQFLKAIDMCTIDAGESPFSVKPASGCVSNRNPLYIFVEKIHETDDQPWSASGVWGVTPNLETYRFLIDLFLLKSPINIEKNAGQLSCQRVRQHSPSPAQGKRTTMCIYIYTRNAWALPRRSLEVSHSQTNGNDVETLPAYGKYN